jgi:hypothetical protein
MPITSRHSSLSLALPCVEIDRAYGTDLQPRPGCIVKTQEGSADSDKPEMPFALHEASGAVLSE